MKEHGFHTGIPINERTYLVTGGAGFIGSHLCERLLSLGCRVLAIDDLSTGRLSNIEHLQHNPQFSFARANITDAIVMDRLASQARVIVHLAAAVGVKLIVDDPVHTIETNVMGTEAVLRSGLRYQCRVLIASTSEVYGKGTKLPFSEEDDVLLGATNRCRWAYAASKMVDEFLALAYQRQYQLQTIVARLFNTVGPRQSGQYGMVIPRFVRQALNGEPLTLYGDGTQRRCFCHVADVVEALVGLSCRPEACGRVFNIGSTEEVSIIELAKSIIRLTGTQSPLKLIPYEQAYGEGFEDMVRRVPDTSRVLELLGWRPTMSLVEILGSVIDYERQALRQPRAAHA